MRDQTFEQLTPWRVVQRRFFDGRSPSVLAFSEKHKLEVLDVLKLFSGEVISFSLEMCEALSRETGCSSAMFRNLSNRWPPHPPPAASAALSQEGRFLYQNLKKRFVMIEREVNAIPVRARNLVERCCRVNL